MYCQLQVYSLKVLMVELDNVQAVQAASYFLGIMHTNDNYEYSSIMNPVPGPGPAQWVKKEIFVT